MPFSIKRALNNGAKNQKKQRRRTRDSSIDRGQKLVRVAPFVTSSRLTPLLSKLSGVALIATIPIEDSPDLAVSVAK